MSIFFITILALIDDIVAQLPDEWLDVSPDERFSHRNRYNSIYTKEDNVTWRIGEDLRYIEVRRTSWLCSSDDSTTKLAVKYDHLKNVTVGVYSDEKRVSWKFVYAKDHLVFTAEDRLLGQMRLDVNGTLPFHPDGVFQVGFTEDAATGEKWEWILFDV